MNQADIDAFLKRYSSQSDTVNLKKNKEYIIFEVFKVLHVYCFYSLSTNSQKLHSRNEYNKLNFTFDVANQQVKHFVISSCV